MAEPLPLYHGQARLRLLLVEDNPADARLIRELLRDAGGLAQFEIEHAERLAIALEWMKSRSWDAILADLMLPDSQGLATLEQLRTAAPEIPVVVLTGLVDAQEGSKALHAGAQDFLLKGEVTGPLLGRALGYAIERNILQRELEQARQREREEQELKSLERFSQDAPTTITARLFGHPPLRESLGEESFQGMVHDYQALLEASLHREVFKTSKDIQEGLRTLVERLGFLRAGPRDLVEIHSMALKGKTKDKDSMRQQAYVEEGRYLVLETMGKLVSYYRNFYPGGRVKTP